ncbi:hypothetical protein phiST2_0181 [Vibrio phage phi-ST2]|nr:hypothetical protein phiST2_0181 [Vibrio phage phi-ST2]QBX06158.1 hypothetical protein Va3_205 [Vibrio phage Va3]QNJ55171.1 hypothetical protein vBValMR11Z_245 [Vibrio phage vB_ValM_R11Z]URQ03516.1 hypothetical protein PVA23_139 [Vibrio phage PVA23]
MNYISVWCEYDIGGDFGGNNNEDVFSVSEELSNEEVEAKVAEYISDIVSEPIEELEGLYGWEYISITQL